MNVDAFRNGRDGLANRLHAFLGNAGLAATLVVVRQAKALPFAVQPIGFLGFERFARFKLAVEIGFEISDLLLYLLRRQNTFLHKALGVDFARRGMALDLGVHDRLGEHGLIALIVPEATIAEHVDNDVLAEFLAILSGHFGSIGDRFRVITIHMEDRRLHHQRNIGRIW